MNPSSIEGASDYRHIQHPNMRMSEQDEREPKSKENGGQAGREDNARGCGFYFSKLDEEILRPLLIYKYESEAMEMQDEHYDLMMSDTNILGSIYGKVDLNYEMQQSGSEEIMMSRVSNAVSNLALDIREVKGEMGPS